MSDLYLQDMPDDTDMGDEGAADDDTKPQTAEPEPDEDSSMNEQV